MTSILFQVLLANCLLTIFLVFFTGQNRFDFVKIVYTVQTQPLGNSLLLVSISQYHNAAVGSFEDPRRGRFDCSRRDRPSHKNRIKY